MGSFKNYAFQIDPSQGTLVLTKVSSFLQLRCEAVNKAKALEGVSHSYEVLSTRLWLGIAEGAI
jgi:hypothetical protein